MPGPPAPAPRTAAKTRNLRFEERVREACRLRHYSLRTEEAYRLRTRRFILFYGKRHPDETGAAEITAFLADLAAVRDVAAST